jgi:hypothetical protein
MNMASVKKGLEAKGIRDEVFTLESGGTAIVYSVYGLLEKLHAESDAEHFSVLGETISHPDIEPKHVRAIFIDIAKALADFDQN